MSIFTELSYVIAIATVMAFLMRLLKQPLIIGHILTGIIVGPFVLNIVQSEETFETFASLGIVLLLFIIGLGLNPKVIKDVGKVSVVTGTGQVVGTTALGTLLAMSPIVGLDFKSALFVGIALAFSSTIIILKLVGDKKELTRLYGKILVGMLLVQDILATLALVFVSAGSGDGVSVADFGGLFLRSLLLGTAIYMIGLRILPKLQNAIAGSQEFLFLFALGWGFSVATLFDLIGFSLEVGALFAGVALATLPYAQEISARLKPLRDFFIIVFFISLGTHLGIGDVGTVILPALGLSLLVLLFNPAIIMSILGLQGYTKKTSFKAGVAMAQISEFSLVFVILAQRQGMIDSKIVSLVTMIAIITIAVSAYMIIYTDQIYAWLEKRTRLFEHRKLGYEQGGRSYDMVLFGYKRGGREFTKIFNDMSKNYVVVDYDPEAVDMMEKHKIPHIYGDATDPEILGEIEIEKAKLVISVINDYETNKFLVTEIKAISDKIVTIVEADSAEEAMELYSHGASYVILPHFIGSEKISSFIKKNGYKVSEFKKYKQKHIAYIESHHTFKTD
jgi:Kef-type K+ transport system membrane component KefB/voltage-gated potassium channel Kch